MIQKLFNTVIIIISCYYFLPACLLAENSYELWDSQKNIPCPEKIYNLEEVTYVRINRAIEGMQFLHGPSIVFYDNMLYSSWASSPVNENSGDESVKGKYSKDEGISWSDIFTIAPDIKGLRRRSHGSFLVHNGTLWIFTSNFTGSDQPLKKGQIYFHDLKTEAFQLDNQSQKWKLVQTVANDFWPMDEPTKLKNGNWIVGGLDKNFKAAIAIIDKNDIFEWQVVKIPQPQNKYYAETTVLVDGSDVTAIMRNHSAKFAAVSKSTDNGKTWSVAGESNYPMAPSKPCAGVLSTNQHYLISNLDRKRSLLTIAVSEPGKDVLSSVWIIRRGLSRQPLFKGWAKSPQWSYPYAFEYNKKLYVIYSVGKEDCELAIIPLRSLNLK